MLKANSENKIGKTIFYVFEGCALAVGVILLILGIYYSAQYQSFTTFLEYLANAVVNTLIVFGLGKVIDLMYAKKDGKCCKVETESAKTEKAEKSEENKSTE